MLVALDVDLGVRVEAAQASKDRLTYRCPGCREQVIPKQGKVVVWHFAHAKGSSCPFAKESPEHRAMKVAVRDAYAAAGLTSEVEVPVGACIADVAVTFEQMGETDLVAIECQRSRLPAVDVQRKIQAYAAHGFHVLYLVDASVFREFRGFQGVRSLHEKELSVPDWVLEAGIPDESQKRGTEARLFVGGNLTHHRYFVHVFHDKKLWALELTSIWRERQWADGRWRRPADGVLLSRKLTGRLLGQVSLAATVDVFGDGGLTTYMDMDELIRYPDVHPTVKTEIGESIMRLASARRDLGSNRARLARCKKPQSKVLEFKQPADTQLGLGIDEPQRPKHASGQEWWWD